MARSPSGGTSNSAGLAMQTKQSILADSESVTATAPNQTDRFCTRLGTGLRSPSVTDPNSLSSLKSTWLRST